MRLVLCILLSVLFLSCAEQDKSLGIQDIVNQWSDIEKLFNAHGECSIHTELESLIKASDIFCLSLQKFFPGGIYQTMKLITPAHE